LVDATINIVGFVSVDPGRMVDVINFRDWVADEATVIIDITTGLQSGLV
jgi:hypothetical protein